MLCRNPKQHSNLSNTNYSWAVYNGLMACYICMYYSTSLQRSFASNQSSFTHIVCNVTLFQVQDFLPPIVNKAGFFTELTVQKITLLQREANLWIQYPWRLQKPQNNTLTKSIKILKRIIFLLFINFQSSGEKKPLSPDNISFPITERTDTGSLGRQRFQTMSSKPYML